jgi:hypothetical protein
VPIDDCVESGFALIRIFLWCGITSGQVRGGCAEDFAAIVAECITVSEVGGQAEAFHP